MLQLVAFLLTLAIELPVVAVWRRVRSLDCSLPRIVLVSALGTIVTHPIVSWGLRELPWSYWGKIALIEPFAVLGEALIFVWLGRLSWREGFVLALVANATSFALGYIFREQIFDIVKAL